MIALFNFMPTVCPSCGDDVCRSTSPEVQRSIARDYMAGASHTCANCGLQFQYVRSTVCGTV